jgi:hypothetical protein
MNEAPATTPKLVGYAFANPPAANDIPIELQSIAFLTRSYTKRQQQERNIRYLTLREIQEAVGSKATGLELCDQTSIVRWPGAMLCVGFESPR